MDTWVWGRGGNLKWEGGDGHFLVRGGPGHPEVGGWADTLRWERGGRKSEGGGKGWTVLDILRREGGSGHSEVGCKGWTLRAAGKGVETLRREGVVDTLRWGWGVVDTLR